ncbi:MAG: metallophosphoesterase [Bacteroidales bacterium]|nr:metallophosphoesterase [Bacteroidales bacterium]
MKKLPFILAFCLTAVYNVAAQPFAFISDTQGPMKVETVIMKTERNIEATDKLLADLSRIPHRAVFFLGDMVSTGSSFGAWERIDRFLTTMRERNTPVYAAYGNHEYMLLSSVGEKNFAQRFPNIPNTGYIVVQDSIAVVVFNSNFSKLNKNTQQTQHQWYERSLDSLNKANDIKFIIVACHHAPYTNSNVVNPNKNVQELYVPAYVNTPKAALFLSGHSHHLEYFDIYQKKFLVIGGGGGLWQDFKKESKHDFTDLIGENQKPRYFYLQITRIGNSLQASVRGFTVEDFGKFEDYPIVSIPFSTTTPYL